MWFLWVLGSFGNFCIVVYIIGNIEFGVKVRDLLVMVDVFIYFEVEGYKRLLEKLYFDLVVV